MIVAGRIIGEYEWHWTTTRRCIPSVALLLPLHRTGLDIFPSSTTIITALFASHEPELVLLKTLEGPGSYVFFALHIGDACER
jgi:hypothetical protein